MQLVDDFSTSFLEFMSSSSSSVISVPSDRSVGRIWENSGPKIPDLKKNIGNVGWEHVGASYEEEMKSEKWKIKRKKEGRKEEGWRKRWRECGTERIHRDESLQHRSIPKLFGHYVKYKLLMACEL